jgi:hypothetical protein
MDKDYNNDTDELLIKAYQEYFFWNDRFIRFGYKVASLHARNALKDIRQLARIRRREILAARNLRRQTLKQKSNDK